MGDLDHIEQRGCKNVSLLRESSRRSAHEGEQRKGVVTRCSPSAGTRRNGRTLGTAAGVVPVLQVMAAHRRSMGYGDQQDRIGSVTYSSRSRRLPPATTVAKRIGTDRARTGALPMRRTGQLNEGENRSSSPGRRDRESRSSLRGWQGNRRVAGELCGKLEPYSLLLAHDLFAYETSPTERSTRPRGTVGGRERKKSRGKNWGEGSGRGGRVGVGGFGYHIVNRYPG